METIAVDLDEVVCFDHETRLLPEAEFCLRSLSRHFNLEVVTARNPRRREATGIWIATSLGGIFSAVHFNRDYKGQHITKGEVCVDIGATYLIDNLEEHCAPANELGITAVQFGVDVANWTDTLDFFEKKLLTRPIHSV